MRSRSASALSVPVCVWSSAMMIVRIVVAASVSSMVLRSFRGRPGPPSVALPTVLRNSSTRPVRSVSVSNAMPTWAFGCFEDGMLAVALRTVVLGVLRGALTLAGEATKGMKLSVHPVPAIPFGIPYPSTAAKLLYLLVRIVPRSLMPVIATEATNTTERW